MTATIKRLRRTIFGIPVAETTFARRGFRGGGADARDHLERIGRTFLIGYHTAMEEGRPDPVWPRLAAVDPGLRGFAFEGAAMALTLLDHILPGRGDRLRGLLNGLGLDHVYMIHVGVGWAIARLPWLRRDPARGLTGLDPLLRWLALDGFGFHEGYFSWPRTVERRRIPRQLASYSRRAFDQGLGRSLWFVDGGDAGRIPATIASFDAGRHADLWSGVGLACAYAGGVGRASVEALREASGLYMPHLAQGSAFAAKARARAGNPAEHTGLACEVFCGLSAGEAASVTDKALAGLPADTEVPAYEVWRSRIRSHFMEEAAAR